ncbi:MAG: hypothetical protein K0Q59_4235 [Paenibacillus sp.]|nr:hypothetical protein [Paenibacillus sp.]
MLCQECNKKPATLHFQKIINGDKTEFRICESCAREKSELIPGTANGFSIHNLLSGLLFDPGQASIEMKPQTLRCENCGLSYGQFSKIGRFGCSSCYQHFGEKLDPLFKRVHGNNVHVGKVPKRTGGLIQYKREIDKLKQEMQMSISREEFEQAARIRDQIRELETKLNGSNL